MRTASRSRFAFVGMAMAAVLVVAGLPFAQPVAAATFNVIAQESPSRLFVPQNLGNITAGDTIVWAGSAGTHDVTSATIPATAVAWASPFLTSAATTFSRTFTVAGNYRYFCSLHSDAAQANLATQSTTQQVGQFTVVADLAAPNAPTGLTATGFSGSQINLAWTVSSPADATSQQIFRNTVNTKPGTPIATIANNTTASYADTGLTAATTYWYWLDAVDGAGNRSTSATASAATVSVNATTTAQQIVLFDIAATLQLSVTPASINFGPVSPAAAAPTAVGATVANVRSNGGWTLAVKSIGTNAIDDAPGDDAVFTSGLNTVPVARMGWRVNPGVATPGTAPYTPLSDLNATIGAPATVATPALGVDTYLQYQLTSLYSDPPALAYRTVLLFTATSP